MELDARTQWINRLFYACRRNDIDGFKRLMPRRRLWPEEEDNTLFLKDDGQHLLHYAVSLDRLDMVQCILEHGCDVNCTLDSFQGANNATPLMVAAYYKNEAMVGTLLALGAESGDYGNSNESTVLELN